MPKIHNLERDKLDYWRQHTTEYLNDILKLTEHFKVDKRIGSRRLLIQFVINERKELSDAKSTLDRSFGAH